MKRLLSTAILAAIATVVPSAGAAIVDSVNQSASPATTFWSATDVGWYYTPAFSYTLTGIDTKFGSSDGRTVTAVIFTAAPFDGGVLLGSGDFVPVENAFAGGTFTGVPLTSGTTYFVGFENVDSLSVNVTDDAGATILTPTQYDFGHTMLFDLSETGTLSSQPILQFNSVVPEPSCLGIIFLGTVGILRRRV